MKSSRKRNVARKARGNMIRTGSVSAPLHADPQSGFVSQNAHPPTSDLHHSPPEAGIREPEAGIRFVSQNRLNAQHSTGPRTPEGKAASSQNARKHGLSIQRHAVLGGEDPVLYEQLLAELRAIFEPRSPRESLAVEDIAQCRWALARFDQAEAAALRDLTGWMNDPEAFEVDEPLGVGESLARAAAVCAEYTRQGRCVLKPNIHYPAFEHIHRYRTWWERKHTRALAEFDRAQRARHAEANQLRAEAKAQRVAEAHALKLELALAREARRQELHAQRLARTHARRAAPQPESASPEPTPATGTPESACTPESAPEEAALAMLESLLNAPAPLTMRDFLRGRSAPSGNGFVSQPAPAKAGTGERL